MNGEIEWPREIWMAERDDHDQGIVSAVLSEHATVARFEGDTERAREFHRYVDADIYETAERYWRARVAAAYEAAAKRNELTVRSIKEALDMRDWDAAREIAMKGPPAIRALTPADAKAALEAVRREARAEALRKVLSIANDAKALCEAGHPVSAFNLASQIIALIDNPQEDKT